MNDVNGSGSATDLITKESAIRDGLDSIIQRMTPNKALRDDLKQEAMLHLWLTGHRRPGQTLSWYLQSCRFHLQHYLNAGRSVDSMRRWRDQSQLDETSDNEDEASNSPVDSDNSVVTWVSAREIIALLKRRLSLQERAVLDRLADGLGPREIGRQLELSHPMVIRHRQKIASLLARLETADYLNRATTMEQGTKKVDQDLDSERRSIGRP